MDLYYSSRKFSSYNCTIYESGTQNAYAYLWGELNGKRGCNEIVTCIHNYLTDIDIKKIHEYVALYCDSCTGQKKNRAMLAMISKSLKSQFTYIKEIKIVFLLPGHTYMPVDSVHASIERFVKDNIHRFNLHTLFNYIIIIITLLNYYVCINNTAWGKWRYHRPVHPISALK